MRRLGASAEAEDPGTVLPSPRRGSEFLLGQRKMIAWVISATTNPRRVVPITGVYCKAIPGTCKSRMHFVKWSISDKSPLGEKIAQNHWDAGLAHLRHSSLSHLRRASQKQGRCRVTGMPP